MSSKGSEARVLGQQVHHASGMPLRASRRWEGFRQVVRETTTPQSPLKTMTTAVTIFTITIVNMSANIVFSTLIVSTDTSVITTILCNILCNSNNYIRLQRHVRHASSVLLHLPQQQRLQLGHHCQYRKGHRDRYCGYQHNDHKAACICT